MPQNTLKKQQDYDEVWGNITYVNKIRYLDQTNGKGPQYDRALYRNLHKKW